MIYRPKFPTSFPNLNEKKKKNEKKMKAKKYEELSHTS